MSTEPRRRIRIWLLALLTQALMLLSLVSPAFASGFDPAMPHACQHGVMIHFHEGQAGTHHGCVGQPDLRRSSVSAGNGCGRHQAGAQCCEAACLAGVCGAALPSVSPQDSVFAYPFQGSHGLTYGIASDSSPLGREALPALRPPRSLS